MSTHISKRDYDNFTQCMKSIQLADKYGYNHVVCSKLHEVYVKFLQKQGNKLQIKPRYTEITLRPSLR